MVRSGFKRKTLDEVKATQAAKRHKIVSRGVKPRKTIKGTTKTKRAKKMELKRNLCEQYRLPIIPCSRWGTAKAPTRTDLLRGMLWTVFSKYIRERDRDKPCISCGKYHEAKQAGHYAPVGDSPLSLWFQENNVHGECPDCNAWSEWHLVPMRKNLVRIYGEEAVAEIDRIKESKMSVKWEESHYVDLIKKYLHTSEM